MHEASSSAAGSWKNAGMTVTRRADKDTRLFYFIYGDLGSLSGLYKLFKENCSRTSGS
jgi:hypothetical protein